MKLGRSPSSRQEVGLEVTSYCGRDRPHLTIDHRQSSRVVVDELGGRFFFYDNCLEDMRYEHSHRFDPNGLSP